MNNTRNWRPGGGGNENNSSYGSNGSSANGGNGVKSDPFQSDNSQNDVAMLDSFPPMLQESSLGSKERHFAFATQADGSSAPDASTRENGTLSEDEQLSSENDFIRPGDMGSSYPINMSPTQPDPARYSERYSPDPFQDETQTESSGDSTQPVHKAPDRLMPRTASDRLQAPASDSNNSLESDTQPVKRFSDTQQVSNFSDTQPVRPFSEQLAVPNSDTQPVGRARSFDDTQPVNHATPLANRSQTFANDATQRASSQARALINIESIQLPSSLESSNGKHNVRGTYSQDFTTPIRHDHNDKNVNNDERSDGDTTHVSSSSDEEDDVDNNNSIEESILRPGNRRKRHMISGGNGPPSSEIIPSTSPETITLAPPTTVKRRRGGGLLSQRPYETPLPSRKGPPALPKVGSGVWARWRDGNIYTAIYKGGTINGKAGLRRQVVYGDGQDDEASMTYDLDIVPGDKVKISGQKGATTYEVVSLEYEPLLPNWQIYTNSGHNAVTIKGTGKNENEGPISLRDIYMTGRAWTLRKRETAISPTKNDEPETESPAAHSAKSGSPSKPKTGNMFENCIFVISGVSGDELSTLSKAILEGEGKVSKTGLREIFDFKTARTGTCQLSYKGSVERTDAVRFGAVISKNCTRTPKFLEGLALGLPCLSWRFILDCQSRGQFIETWQQYLLAAGTSDVLDNSYISYNMQEFYERWVGGQTLHEQFLARDLILGAVQCPLYVVSSKFPKLAEELNTICFLIAAIGGHPIKLGATASHREITKKGGGIVIDLSQDAAQLQEDQPRNTKKKHAKSTSVFEIIGSKKPKTTILLTKEWVIQCIINRRMLDNHI